MTIALRSLDLSGTGFESGPPGSPVYAGLRP